MAKEYKDYEKFKALMKQAIGPNRTQSEFARELGVTRQYMSNIMNDPNKTVPTIEFLTKVSGHSYGGITLDGFLDACGYDEKVVKSVVESELEKLSIEDRIKRCVTLMEQGFTEQAGNNIYESIYEYADLVMMLYSEEDISISIYDTIKLQPKEQGYSEKACIVQLTWGDERYEVMMDILVTFCQTEGGSFIINKALFDQKSLKKYGSQAVEKLYISDQYIPDGKAVVIKKKIKKTTPEERLLIAIFGEEGKEEKFANIEGIGFYIDKDLEYVFKKFIKNHKDTFIKDNVDEVAYIDYIDEGESIDDAFCQYKSDYNETIKEGWGTAVCNIINRETGLHVSFYIEKDEDEENDFEDNKYMIMFPKRNPWEYNDIEKNVTEEFINITLDKYARELRSCVTTLEFSGYTKAY